MTGRFEEMTVLITGAGSGIGQETSLAFAETGAVVIGVDRSEDGLGATAALIASTGAHFEALVADVGRGSPASPAAPHNLLRPSLTLRLQQPSQVKHLGQSATITPQS